MRWWGDYWTQWVVQNVLPPSFWTLLGIGIAYVGHRARSIRQHAEQLAEGARRHAEAMAQASRHHEALKQHMTVHCADVKEHVSATSAQMSAAVAVPQQLIDDIKKARPPSRATRKP